MKRILAILALLLAPFAVAAESATSTVETTGSSSCPLAVATFQSNMAHRVLHTVEAGFMAHEGGRNSDWTNDLTVRITLKHALIPAWTCATWSVDLLLPDHITMRTGTASRTSLTHASEAVFELDHSHVNPDRTLMMGEHQFDRVVFVVRVYNGDNIPLHYVEEGLTDGEGRWHFPVRLGSARARYSR